MQSGQLFTARYLAAVIAYLISSASAMPVDMIMGLPVWTE
jgi:hypothetical protein